MTFLFEKFEEDKYIDLTDQKMQKNNLKNRSSEVACSFLRLNKLNLDRLEIRPTWHCSHRLVFIF